MTRPESPLLHAARISIAHPRMRAVDALGVLVGIAVLALLGVMVGATLLDIVTDSESSVRAFAMWLISVLPEVKP